MAYKITNECIACGACESECPTDAIASGDPIYTIDAEKCIDCGACEGVCPTNAIEA
ncbi:MAG: 4Fe-4S binding protein [Oscillospiraceae bacterium]|nr:4Fe-4S binding protein [Oscillospiraceae bacterium]